MLPVSRILEILLIKSLLLQIIAHNSESFPRNKWLQKKLYLYNSAGTFQKEKRKSAKMHAFCIE